MRLIDGTVFLEWLKGEVLLTVFGNGNLNTIRQTVFADLVDTIESGKFDIPSNQGEARLREALQFYADPSTYDTGHLDKYGYIIIDKDGGNMAREALGITIPGITDGGKADE